MKPKKKKKVSLLGRLFGKKKKKAGPAKAAPPAKAKPRPLTPLDRSIAQIKQMVHIGQKDPERLAMILGKMLREHREQKRRDQEKLDQVIRDILSRQEGGKPPSP